MANSYDQEFNRSFPEQIEGPEFAPNINYGKNKKKSYGLRKLLMALSTAAAAALIVLSPLGFDVTDIETDSALLVYDYEVQNDPKDEIILNYRLYEKQELIRQGEMEQGNNELLLDELKPDTLYILRVWNGEEHIKTLRFRTKPVNPIGFTKPDPDGGFEPGIGGGEDEEEPEVKASATPIPTVQPSASPVPTASPTPSPTPRPTATPVPTQPPAPVVPEPAPVVPTPIPATPAPTPAPTNNPYYDPAGNATTNPDAVVYYIGTEYFGEKGRYSVTVYPELNTSVFDIDNVGIALKRGNASYGSAMFEGYDPYGYTVECLGGPGTYSIELAVYFTNKNTGVSDSVLITEPVTITTSPPSIRFDSVVMNDDGSISLVASIDEMDYAGSITNVTATANDSYGNEIVVYDQDSNPLTFTGLIPKEQVDAFGGYTATGTVKVFYNDGTGLQYVEESIYLPLN